MKVKEVERTGHVSWSPVESQSIYLACGTSAQQLDATFSSASRLEIFALGLDDVTMKMPLVAHVDTPARFQCMQWGAHSGSAGSSGGQYPAGLLVGGIDGGELLMYSPQRLLDSASSSADASAALVHRATRHTGAVQALDFNPYQGNLLASGAADSEIFIWDLNSPGTPMTPGNKIQPTESVSALSWNRQVQHILASTFTSRCVVWDLRKNEPIVKIADSQSGMRCKVVAWHPEVATQLVLASEDDHTPVIQLWDLRFATAPLRSFAKHQKGILSLAWNQRDSHLLLSAGKDDKILCWDPHVDAAEQQVVAELSASNQWNFSVSWCPRSPALIAGCSFDGRLAVYNVMGTVEEPPTSPSAELADSFPDMAGVAAALPSIQRRVSVPLSRPPVWMKRPCGASFSFGGRLVSFHNVAGGGAGETVPGGAADAGVKSASCQPTVEIRQVITEPELVGRCQQFQQVLESGQFNTYCGSRAELAEPRDQLIWQFLGARFDPQSPRSRLLQLLGYCPEAAGRQLNMEQDSGEPPQNGNMMTNNVGDENDVDDGFERWPAAAAGDDAGGAAGQPCASPSDSTPAEPEELFDIPTGDDADGQVSLAILRGDLTEAVNRCMEADRSADALIIALATSQQLFVKTRDRYLESMKTDMSWLIGALVSGDWSRVVSRCDPGSWREALVAILTHASPHQQPALCTELGSRLEVQHTEAMWTSAMLCYICAGNVQRLVACWERTRPDATSPLALQELVEQALTLERANQLTGTAIDATSDGLRRKLIRYADLLTSQGCLEPVLHYLANANSDPEAAILYERVQRSLMSTASSAGATVAPQKAQIGSVAPAAGGYTAPAPKYQRSNASSSHGFQQQQSVPPASIMSPAAAPRMAVPPLASAVPSPASMVPTQMSPAIGGTASTGGYRLGGRRQYIADPSTAGPGYGPTAMGGMSYAPTSTPAMMNSTASFSPPQYGSPAPLYGDLGSGQQSMTAAVNTFTPSMQPGVTPSVSAVSAGQTGSMGGPPPMLTPRTSSGPGWNDPPPLRSSKKTIATSTTSMMHAVGQPIYNPAEMTPAANQYVTPVSGYPASSAQTPGVFQPPAQAPPHSGAAGAPPSAGGHYSPYQQQNSVQSVAAAVEPELPVEKGPVPAEHAVIQQTLDRLRDACLSAAANPQVRRKLDDVTKKLEVFYDLLRSGRVAPNTLAGLHQLMPYLCYGDYNNSLAVVQQVVAASNFAEISRYMPGVKTLVQLAGQLQVPMTPQ